MSDRRIRAWETGVVAAMLGGGAASLGLQFQSGEGLDMAVPALLVVAAALTAVAALVLVRVFDVPLARFQPWPAHAAIVYASVLLGSAPWAHALNRLLDRSPRVELHGVGVSTWIVKTRHFSDVRRTDGPRAGQVLRLSGEYGSGAPVTFVTRRGLFGWEWMPGG